MLDDQKKYVVEKTGSILQKIAQEQEQAPVIEEVKAKMNKIAKEVLASAPEGDVNASAVFLVGHSQGYEEGLKDGYIKSAAEHGEAYFNLFMKKIAGIYGEDVATKVAEEMEGMDQETTDQLAEIFETSKEEAINQIAEEVGGPEVLVQKMEEDPELGDQIDELTDQVAGETVSQIMEEATATEEQEPPA